MADITEVIHPRSQAEWLALRTKDVTSTESAALFGLSPYITEFELWHRKKHGNIVEFETTERMKWGTRLQEAIARGVGEDQKWSVRPMTEYMRDPERRMGSSFDFEVTNAEKGKALLEIKNVDATAFRDGWMVDDDYNIEAPPHIEMQVQHQLAVSGRERAHIAALVGGNRVVIIARERDEKIIGAIRRRVADFWSSIDTNSPPSPDFQKDAEFIASLYQHSEPGSVFQGADSVELTALMAEYRMAGEAVKESTAKKDAAKARILMMIGDAEKVIGNGFTISAGIVPPAPISYTREAYRMFKPSYKKEKKS